jgi:uncharacterized membrane protein YkoI
VDYAYLATMNVRWIPLVMALLCASPASAACLSDREARRAIAQNGLITPADVMDIAVSGGGELVSARLCEGGSTFVYRVAVIDPDGRVTRLVIDAGSGKIVSGR